MIGWNWDNCPNLKLRNSNRILTINFLEKLEYFTVLGPSFLPVIESWSRIVATVLEQGLYCPCNWSPLSPSKSFQFWSWVAFSYQTSINFICWYHLLGPCKPWIYNLSYKAYHSVNNFEYDFVLSIFLRTLRMWMKFKT